MTVIAWDGVTLAADRMGHDGNSVFAICKLFRVSDTCLAGVAGQMQSGLRIVGWLRSRANPGANPTGFPAIDPEKDWTVVLTISREDGEIVVRRYEAREVPIVVEDDQHAIGQGAAAAMAAMRCGSSAVDAVRIASDLHTDCGLGQDELRLPDPPEAGTDSDPEMLTIVDHGGTAE